MDSNLFLIVLVLGLIGLLGSIFYYFARFFFKDSDERDKKSELKDEKTPNKVPSYESGFKEPRKKSVSLEEALNSTREHFFGRIKKVFKDSFAFSSEELEDLEEVLYTSDLGVKTVESLIEDLRVKNSKNPFSNFDELKKALKEYMLEAFGEPSFSHKKLSFPEKGSPTVVWMIVGVNGVGKTTTIGKLAFKASQKGLKVLVVAGDRFRAAAESQLEVWTKRACVDLFNPPQVKDPSAVIFDGLKKAHKGGYDLVIVDTAGRLHTQEPLIRELEKSKRVVKKVFEKDAEEILQVLDANSGQNALIQTQKFHEVLGLTGVILTKLDGSAKGGVALGLVKEYKLPIKAIGVGEGVEDLRPFHSEEFVHSILS